ncbi:hypothetical protein DEU32_11416 [Curtobacterium sp. AG1037]|uniref:PQQ-like beta-propeller repeat protein n=1 Tax=Curtobacterium sp. AG1037 TaxID=2183990 RepID=UPI000E0C4005|nr:PQQ-like beta-propeller repeat protein [Curtobacterium sp. AG1037]RDH95051.1 hypothetical protein DEU32_11416 [Curtobacterium sp. AG1037]
MTDAFDPTTVPPFPVVTLDLRDDDTVAVDGQPIDIGPDESPRDAGIAAVAARARAQRLQAVRVRATSPDGTHLMVVTDEGRPYALDDPSEATEATRRRTQKRTGTLILAGACVVVVALGGGLAAYAIGSNRPAPVATAAPTPPNQGSQLPVVAPPGYSQTAAWAVKVTKQTAPVLIDGDRIAAVDDSGNLRIINTQTGQTTWRGAGAPSGRAGVTYTHVENRPVLASASSQSITLWPIDTKDGKRTAGTSVPIGARATVSYLGSAPLIDLGDQTVALLTSDGVVRKDVPVTASPILATQDSVVAANGDRIYTVPASGKTTDVAMTKPKGAKGSPELISAADDSTLIVLWPSDDEKTDIAALVNVADGSTLATARVDTRSADERDVPVQSVTSKTLALGSLFVDYGKQPAIVQVEDFSPTVVDEDTVYGLFENMPAAATRDGNSFKTTSYTPADGFNDRTLPAAVTGGTAFIVAEKVENTYLYALPRATEASR